MHICVERYFQVVGTARAKSLGGIMLSVSTTSREAEMAARRRMVGNESREPKGYRLSKVCWATATTLGLFQMRRDTKRGLEWRRNII